MCFPAMFQALASAAGGDREADLGVQWMQRRAMADAVPGGSAITAEPLPPALPPQPQVVPDTLQAGGPRGSAGPRAPGPARPRALPLPPPAPPGAPEMRVSDPYTPWAGSPPLAAMIPPGTFPPVPPTEVPPQLRAGVMPAGPLPAVPMEPALRTANPYVPPPVAATPPPTAAPAAPAVPVAGRGWSDRARAEAGLPPDPYASWSDRARAAAGVPPRAAGALR